MARNVPFNYHDEQRPRTREAVSQGARAILKQYMSVVDRNLLRLKPSTESWLFFVECDAGACRVVRRLPRGREAGDATSDYREIVGASMRPGNRNQRLVTGSESPRDTW